MNRRDFLKTGSCVTAGTLIGTGILAACNYPAQPLKKLGVISGTIREELDRDYVQALEQVAEIGYTYLEFGGHYGPSVKDFTELLNRLGLVALAGGTNMQGMLEGERLKEMIAEALELGKQYLVCYWPWLSDARNLTMEELKEAAGNLNRIGLTCQSEGIKFAFHNHDKEFWPVGGVIPFDFLMDNTDPALVIAELDLYWIKKGNADPVPYFKKYPGRFELIHAKDMDQTQERSFACVGDGIIDFPEIFSHADQAGMKHILVEHDRPQHPMQCITDSYNYLQSIL